jgi:hypothetical protein
MSDIKTNTSKKHKKHKGTHGMTIVVEGSTNTCSNVVTTSTHKQETSSSRTNNNPDLSTVGNFVSGIMKLLGD